MSNAQITYLCFASLWDLNPFGPEYLDSYLISSNWFSFGGGWKSYKVYLVLNGNNGLLQDSLDLCLYCYTFELLRALAKREKKNWGMKGAASMNFYALVLCLAL